MAEAVGRCAIRGSRPPRLREDLAGLYTRRSEAARRSRRIPVRTSDRTWCPQFPGGSRFPHHGLGAALTSPNLLIRAAAGFPLRRGGQGRPVPRCWQLQPLILFREVINSFRGGLSGLGKTPLISHSSSSAVLDVLEGVVEAAEELPLLHAGMAAVRPVVAVVDVAPSRASVTSTFPGAVTITGDDGPSLGRGPYPGLTPDVEDLGVGTEYDAAHRAVTRQHAEGVDVKDVAVQSLVQPSSDPVQSGNVGDDADVGLLAPDYRCVAMLEPCP